MRSPCCTMLGNKTLLKAMAICCWLVFIFGVLSKMSGNSGTVGYLQRKPQDDMKPIENNFSEKVIVKHSAVSVNVQLPQTNDRDKLNDNKLEKNKSVDLGKKTSVLGKKPSVLPKRQSGQELKNSTAPKETNDQTKSSRKHPNLSGIYQMPSKGTWVAGGAFIDKISQYNNVIENTRKQIISKGQNDTWQPLLAKGAVELVAGNAPDYLVKFSNVPRVTGIFLSWNDRSGLTKSGSWNSQLDKSNLLIQNYFPWTGSAPFCKNLQKPFTRHRWDTVFNKQCSTNMSNQVKSTSLELYFLNAVQLNIKYFMPNNGNVLPDNFYIDVPKYITYMHIIKDGVITNIGNVFTGQYKIVPFNCHPGFEARPPNFNINKTPLYDEVLSLAQYWGGAFFHKMLEDYPKLAPYINFLKKNPTIKIQVGETGSYTASIITRLGLDPSRLVTGDVRARIVYLPRGTSCGFTHIQEGQLLSRLIRSTLPVMTHPGADRRNLVLIRRSVHRHFTHRPEIAVIIEKLAKEFGLNFYLFRDDPVPPLAETMLQFNRALMVIAPHGAGLSNILYSEPGTYVIEGICNPPHTNMCYTRLAHLLGHHYHAMISRGGCEGHVDIDISEIEQTVHTLLQLMQENGEI